MVLSCEANGFDLNKDGQLVETVENTKFGDDDLMSNARYCSFDSQCDIETQYCYRSTEMVGFRTLKF